MTEFQEKNYVVVRNFLDPDSVRSVSKYLENKIKRHPDINDSEKHPEKVSRFSWYADPLIETVLENSTTHAEEVTGLQLFPTYSYTRVYMKGDELKAHVDRPSCEISITCHVATVGEPWKIYMENPGGQPTGIELAPGDAVVYKGCIVKHWRHPMENTEINVQFMLHYVDQNGPNAEYKFDKRPYLAYPVRG
jgi:hypothetical protein